MQSRLRVIEEMTDPLQHLGVEVLLDCGYAIKHIGEVYGAQLIKTEHGEEIVNTFEDTLSGRRQADAIEDFMLMTDDPKYTGYWQKAMERHPDELGIKYEHLSRRYLQMMRLAECAAMIYFDRNIEICEPNP